MEHSIIIDSMVMEIRQKHQTSHALHIVLSLLTGIWILVYLMMLSHNQYYRNNALKQGNTLKKFLYSNGGSWDGILENKQARNAAMFLKITPPRVSS